MQLTALWKAMPGGALRNQFIRAMQLTSIFFLAAAITVSAEGLSQNITYTAHNVPLRKVLEDLKQTTGIAFFYPTGLLENATPVTISVRNSPLEKVMQLLLKDQPLRFRIEEQTVIIAKRKILSIVKDLEEVTVPPVGGRIRDAEGNPLENISVVIKGTTTGTLTTADGRFSLQVAAGQRIVISSVGFETQEILIQKDKTVDLVLVRSVIDLGEVVVNKGYYSESKKLSTGNVSKVGTKVIEQQPVTNLMGALIGRVPGLEITQGGGIPGAGFKIRIRGQNSIAAGASPLFIIDGVPFSSESLGNNQVSRQLPFIDGNIAVSPFNSLNPADIASIEVLKDADATAIYGSRGANGVILITTKKGKAGKTQYDFRAMAGFSKVTRTLEMTNTREYLAIRKKIYNDAGVTTYPADAYDINGTWDSTRYTDWYKELIGGTAKNLNGQVGVSGGSDRTQFLLRAGIQKETTVYPGDFHYDRGSFLINISHRSANDRVKLSFSSNYSTDDNNMTASDLTRIALYLSPNAPALYNEDGSLNWENSTWDNPLASQNAKYNGKTRMLNSNLTLDFDLGAGFAAKLNSGYGDYRLDEYMASPSTIYDPVWQATSAYSYVFGTIGGRQNWIVEPQLNWSRKWGKGSLQALVGTTFQHQSSSKIVNYGDNFPSNSLIYDITAAGYQSVFVSENLLYKYHAFFGRVNYNWKEKYLVNITARRDGSSRFSPERQFANFGAIGAAWIFTAEPFIERSLPFLNFGKLRGSYGTTGNDQIGDYQFLNTYATSEGSNYQGIVGLLPTRLYNPDFAWETNRKFEAALEMGMFKDRVFLAIAMYRNRSSSQLVGIPLTGVTGFNSIQSNLEATVQNTGWEFELQVTPVRTSSVKWNISMNLSLPKNKLVAFPNLAASSYSNTYVVGQPLTISRRYHITGTDPVTGIYQYEDVNKDGQLSSTHDRTSIHNMASQYFGGINNSLTISNWQLDVFMQVVKKTGNNYLYFASSPGSFVSNIPKVALKDLWEPGRTDATVQVLYAGGLNSDASRAWNRLYQSSATVTDIFFARLKNVALSYQVPKSWIKGTDGRLFVQAQNLVTLTQYEGADPETESLSSLPPLRTITFGIQLTL